MTDWQLETDEHGDFKYSLKQFLLMRRFRLGGDWTDVCSDVSAEITANSEWDIEARDTYMSWQRWYLNQSEAVPA